MKRSIHGVLPSALFFGGLLAAAPASAGDVDFRPSLSLGAYRNKNVDVLGPASPTAGSVSLSADLPLSYRTATDTLTAVYKPSRSQYRGITGRDSNAHALSLSWARTLSRRADFSMAIDASRSKSQGISDETPDAPLTFIERTRIERYGLSLGGRVQSGRSSNVSWDLRARAQGFQDVEVIDPDTGQPSTVDFNDSRGAGVAVGWTAQTGPNTSNGVSYGFDLITFEDAPRAQVHTLTWRTGSRIGRVVTTSVGIGASHAISNGDSDTSWAVDASLSRQVGEASSLSAGLRQGVAPGGGTTRTTQDQGGYLSWRYAPPRTVSVGLTAGYWRRGEIDFGGSGAAPVTKAWSLAGAFAWQFGRFVALGLSGNYSRQQDPDTRFHSYGLFVRWNIRGR